ncbi:hypothetical protein F6X94_01230 [Enterococcus durans]|nr:hypothetical protein F6X94_01230 [Enterococcus durans]
MILKFKPLNHIKKSISIKHTRTLGNKLNQQYEMKNNLIKIIKRVQFIFRTFRHHRKKMLIQQNLGEFI